MLSSNRTEDEQLRMRMHVKWEIRYQLGGARIHETCRVPKLAVQK